MTRQLVMVHGRAQEEKDSIALKAEWIESLNEGLAKSNLTLPIPETDVRFPFYGDALYDMVQGKSAQDSASVIVRGEVLEDDSKRFIRAVLEEIRQENGVTTEQLAQVAGDEVVTRGPLNWGWTQGILSAIDRFVPYGSSGSIALFTHDVYQYLKNSAIREAIDTGISQAMTPGTETVVVSHSLGTVVAYNLLRREGHLQDWRVPLFVTLGSPLAITEIRKTLKGFAPIRCPQCASAWYNAMDDRDVVALYPLDANRFPLASPAPAIENNQGVRNKTSNRHGIGGYLDDKDVAKRIYDALVA